MKKLKIIIIGIFVNLLFITNKIFATSVLKVNCDGLPGCNGKNGVIASDEGKILTSLSELVSIFMQYAAVFAVLSVMCAGVYYMFSLGVEEKTSKARKWIIWSLIGVVVSLLGYFAINFINNWTLFNY